MPTGKLEFTVDLEMSFVIEKTSWTSWARSPLACGKRSLASTSATSLGWWHDAMEDYGIDRPDLRFDLKLVDCGDWPVTLASGCLMTP